jgi:L-threonylcarbamoyladenylate synthase
MIESNISKAISALKKGNIIVYPTDTLYGLGADIFNVNAIRKVFKIKKRPFNNPLSVAVSDISELEKIADVDEHTRQLVKQYMPGKLTLILKKKEIISDNVTGGLNKVAIRIPDNKIALEILTNFGPITATSANIHGLKTPYIINEIIMQLKENVSVYLDDGRLEGRSSTIVDLTDHQVRIIRKGAIPEKDILDAILDGR